jgi:type 1 glutamine amidotransferase
MKLLPSLRFAAIAAMLLGTLSAADSRKKLVMLISEAEYQTAKSLPVFAQSLEKEFRTVIVSGPTLDTEKHVFDKIDEVATADVLLVSVRRRALPKAQLDVIRRYVAAGKPVIGIRTASHAFAFRPNQTVPEGSELWPEWDAEVFGGSYTNHYAKGGDPIKVTAAAPDSPLLRGVKVPFEINATLYKVSPLKPGAKAILTGAIPNQPAEPVAYTFTRKDGGKSFYVSLGGPDDFKNPNFTTLLRNALLWAAAK